MDCADVLSFVLTCGKIRRQPARDDRATYIEVPLPFLVRWFIAGKGISCIQRCVLEQPLRIAMKGGHAPAIDDLRCGLPTAILAKAVRTVLGSECIVVDPDILCSSSLLLIFVLTMRTPGGELLRSQIILKPVQKFCPHPFNSGSQAIRVIASCGSCLKVHQVAEKILRSAPAIFHHDDDGALLFFGKWQSCLCENALQLVLQFRERGLRQTPAVRRSLELQRSMLFFCGPVGFVERVPERGP